MTRIHANYRQKKRASSSHFRAVFCLFLCFSAPLNANELVFYTEQFPPFNYEEQGEVKGLSVNLLKAMWQHMGEETHQIDLVPWSRGYAQLEKQNNIVLFTTGRTALRENKFQ